MMFLAHLHAACMRLTVVRPLLLLAAFSMPSSLPSQQAPTRSASVLTMPAMRDTSPAGVKLAAYLAAFNSGQRDSLSAFIAANVAAPRGGPLPLDEMTSRHFARYAATHGYTVGKLLSSGEGSIAVAVRARRTGYWYDMRMSVSTDTAHKVTSLGLQPIPAPADLLPRVRLSDAEIRVRADSLVRTLIAMDQFSGAILVARRGQPIYAHASGLASRTWQIANRLDTRFNLASLSKMFTAVGVMQLVERGSLTLDDTLASLLPQFPHSSAWQRVTVRQLLTHTAGLVNGGSGNDILSPARVRLRTISELLASYPPDSLRFEPGSRFDYSNYGYLLLGAIIERVSGKDYQTFVRESVFRPAGMTSTDNEFLESEPSGIATGFENTGSGQRRSNVFVLPARGLPFGMGYSTVHDLDRFATALRTHQLLTERSIEMMWAGNMAFREPDSRYGLGFIATRYNGVRIVGHSGGWPGVTNRVDMYPDDGVTVVILNNVDSEPTPLAYKLREWLTQGH
ncbi:MAG: serine hydrolase domain-containing protein [bacterium]